MLTLSFIVSVLVIIWKVSGNEIEINFNNKELEEETRFVACMEENDNDEEICDKFENQL